MARFLLFFQVLSLGLCHCEPSSSTSKVREVLGYGLKITTGENENFINKQGIHQPWPQDQQQLLLCQEVSRAGSVCLGICHFSSELCGEGRDHC